MVEMWDGIRKQATTKYMKQAIVTTTSPGSFQEAYTIYSEVVNCLENVDARRQSVLAKCRVKETEAWGKGLHIFIPGK